MAAINNDGITECCICLSNWPDTKHILNDSFYELACHHGRLSSYPMHAACLEQHINSMGATCPVCKAAINSTIVTDISNTMML